MRILVVGAGRTGSMVLRQLLKNSRLKVLTLDPRENPRAVKEKIIPAVDFKEALTPLTLEHVLKESKPDLILLAMTSEDFGMGQGVGMDMLISALRDEVATMSDVPVIEVARSAVH